MSSSGLVFVFIIFWLIWNSNGEETGSVNGEVYLKLFEEVLWPSVKGFAARKQYWFQQDGATCSVAKKLFIYINKEMFLYIFFIMVNYINTNEPKD